MRMCLRRPPAALRSALHKIPPILADGARQSSRLVPKQVGENRQCRDRAAMLVRLQAGNIGRRLPQTQNSIFYLAGSLAAQCSLDDQNQFASISRSLAGTTALK